MASQAAPDEIMIIAQFLAARADPPLPWQEFTREAFKLRRELKERSSRARRS
jgi:hypothetical protein